MIELVAYNESFRSQWDNFVSTSKNAVFFHQRNYLSYHLHRFDERSVLIFKKGKLIALFPATAHEQTIVSHGGITFAGLLMSVDLKAAEVISIFQLLQDHYRSQGFTAIEYKAIPFIFQQYPSDEDLYALFRADAKLVRRDISSCIYLPEKLRFSETKRQMVRKCENNNVQIVESENYTAFWQLLTEVVSKHAAKPVHSLEEITMLHQRFPKQIRLFEATVEGKLLAGTVLFDFGKTMHTQYMANSDEGRTMGALDFLIHKLLQEVATDKTYFNFGISTEQQGKLLNEGLILQKEMMGGRAVVYDFYKIVLH